MRQRHRLLLILVLVYSVNITASVSAQTPVATDDPTFVGAGDIASCDGRGYDEATAKLLDDIPGTVFAAGDLAYDTGSIKEFRDCYDPTWGRHKARTRPAPGNHEYESKNAAPYFAYFGDIAGPAGLGYYSFDLGAWHIVSLNSNISADAGSPQELWLRTDLAAHPSECTLAFWHHPVFSSGDHGNDPHMRDIWRVLYEFGADVVINGHDHDYERFAPQDADGHADPYRGIREFVVGTGGKTLRDFVKIRANSEVRNSTTWGVLKLTLHPTSFDWEFIPVPGKTFRDAGSASCVGSSSNSPEGATQKVLP